MRPDIAPYMMNRYETFHFRCPDCKKFYYSQFQKLYKDGDVIEYFRLDIDGKSHTLKSFVKLKQCCESRLQARQVRGVYDPKITCDLKCFESKSQDCICACGGLLHGVSYAAW
jgi:hypothetical protein